MHYYLKVTVQTGKKILVDGYQKAADIRERQGEFCFYDKSSDIH